MRSLALEVAPRRAQPARSDVSSRESQRVCFLPTSCVGTRGRALRFSAVADHDRAALTCQGRW